MLNKTMQGYVFSIDSFTTQIHTQSINRLNFRVFVSHSNSDNDDAVITLLLCLCIFFPLFFQSCSFLALVIKGEQGMSRKTSETPKDVPAVKFPSLSDGYFEIAAICNKRVHKVKFHLYLFFILEVLFFFSVILEYDDHFLVQFLLSLD